MTSNCPKSESVRVAKEASIYLGRHPNEPGTRRLEQALHEPNLQQQPAKCPKFTQGQICHPEFPTAYEQE